MYKVDDDMINSNVCLEISGPTAMWTRPDTGDAPVSYPAPTRGAAKGIIESILRLESARVDPVKVEICSPLVYHSYSTNYGGPLRKTDQIKGGDNYQIKATVLVNVCYRLYAVVLPSSQAATTLSERASFWAKVNGPHAYQEMFERRLGRGQFHRTPCLGWQEFVPDYVGPFRPESRTEDDLTFVLPSMLDCVFPGEGRMPPSPRFRQNVRIEKGVLLYAPGIAPAE
jgi:CRISPR-associated protein Cas5d